MAKRSSHCLYHLGIIKRYNINSFYLHYSSVLVEANKFYRGANFDLSRVIFTNNINIYSSLLLNIFKNKSILIAGLHLWQAILLSPFFILNRSVEIHLHGQAHALKKIGFKYIAWKILSFFTSLKISNPCWERPIFVQKINNLNIINNLIKKIKTNNNKVIYYTAVDKKIINFTSIKKRMTENNLVIEVLPVNLSYEYLNFKLDEVNYLYFESIDDYYLFSPSGRISDAINYNLKLVLKNEDELSKLIAVKYGIEFITI